MSAWGSRTMKPEQGRPSSEKMLGKMREGGSEALSVFELRSVIDLEDGPTDDERAAAARQLKRRGF